MSGASSSGRGLRIQRLFRKEMRQLFRDPKTKRIIFVAPIIQMLLFGYAVNTDVRNVNTIVVDRDRTHQSARIIEALTTSGRYRVVSITSDPRALPRALDGGTAIVGIEIPAGFSSDLQGLRGPALQVLVDGTSSNTATVAQAYAVQVIRTAVLRMAGPAGLAEDAAGPVSLQSRAWFNPALESQVYNVPAVTGVIVFMMCLMLTAMGVVREKELGTMDQLRVSPLSAADLMLGKTLPVALIAWVQLTLVIVVALLWFDIPFRGSIGVLMLGALLFILGGLAIGLLVSTISGTQQEAFFVTFLIMLPAIILSGFMYPIDSMPPFFESLTLGNPLRHFLEIVRAEFLKGSGLAALWRPFGLLTAIAGGLLGAAVWRFRATLAEG